eukprot:GHUV01018948.1.p1 GENE.GHUV01018948.1~~GHUV01018948.1.p1  ORF type:complete len:243 (+),score=68.10 GHUV01018948.1:467-1195(+)
MLPELGASCQLRAGSSALLYSNVAFRRGRSPRARIAWTQASGADRTVQTSLTPPSSISGSPGSSPVHVSADVQQATPTATARTASTQQVVRQRAQPTVSVRQSSSVLPKSQLPVYLGAAAVAAALVLGAYRTFLTGAAKNAAAAVTQGITAKRLQREAASRLNEMSSLIQNSPTADLSAKNLGDEGTAYVAEALAFNTVCLAADFSNNGVGQLGTAQLSEVLPTCALQHLKLHTNNLGKMVT